MWSQIKQILSELLHDYSSSSAFFSANPLTSTSMKGLVMNALHNECTIPLFHEGLDISKQGKKVL